MRCLKPKALLCERLGIDFCTHREKCHINNLFRSMIPPLPHPELNAPGPKPLPIAALRVTTNNQTARNPKTVMTGREDLTTYNKAATLFIYVM